MNLKFAAIFPLLMVGMTATKAWSAETNAPAVISATSDSEEHSNVIGLGNRVIVEVENLSNLVSLAIQEQHDIILYLNGQPLSGSYAETIDLLQNQLQFKLERVESNKPAWMVLLGAPQHFLKEVSVSVGLEGRYPIATLVQGRASLKLMVIRGPWLLGCFIVFVLGLVWFWFVGRKSTMLRDSGPDPGPGRFRPYSLAKCQMAFWFFLILLSFLLIWAITGAHDSITSSVLTLMGIGAGTALGVAVQNKSKEGDSQVLAEIDKLEAQKKQLAAQGQSTDAIKKQIQAKAPASINFLNDILTDADGLSFHRFQMAIWTIVLGVIFVKEVYCNLAMPDFNSTLLALMGISSGTYLGFMIPEGHSTDQSNPSQNKSPDTPVPQPAAGK